MIIIIYNILEYEKHLIGIETGDWVPENWNSNSVKAVNLTFYRSSA